MHGDVPCTVPVLLIVAASGKIIDVYRRQETSTGVDFRQINFVASLIHCVDLNLVLNPNAP